MLKCKKMISKNVLATCSLSISTELLLHLSVSDAWHLNPQLRNNK